MRGIHALLVRQRPARFLAPPREQPIGALGAVLETTRLWAQVAPLRLFEVGVEPLQSVKEASLSTFSSASAVSAALARVRRRVGNARAATRLAASSSPRM